MREVIVNLLPLTPEEQDTFRATAGGCEQRFLPGMDPKGGSIPLSDTSVLCDATILLGNVAPGVLAGAENRKWLQTWSAGVDAFLPAGVLPAHTMLTSAVGAYGPSVSEHMFAVLLSMLKLLPLYRDEQNRCAWTDLGSVRSFAGLRVLVVGAGDIGLKFAAMCKAVGMYTVGLKRTAPACPAELDEVHPLAELDRWLPWADAVLLVLPQAPETVHLMDARRISLMRSDALLLNGGRGSAVDPDALTGALRAGTLRGAALDVTEPEPLPKDHPLWTLPNCLITPHVAGGLHLEGTRGRIVSIALENLRRYLAGEPLRNRMK
ncbi:MAG: D-2-hydroxyacid dehydrogenase [Clostridia bacterium]|nr:D-2-hydroxyacid dehydrogenase [Clostridia bacterium]